MACLITFILFYILCINMQLNYYVCFLIFVAILYADSIGDINYYNNKDYSLDYDPFMGDDISLQRNERQKKYCPNNIPDTLIESSLKENGENAGVKLLGEAIDCSTTAPAPQASSAPPASDPCVATPAPEPCVAPPASEAPSAQEESQPTAAPHPDEPENSAQAPAASDDSEGKAKQLKELVQHLYVAQARVQLEATEIKKAQAVANSAQQALEEATNKVRTITAALQTAQQGVASAAIQAQTAQLQLAAHDQLLFAARQDVDALSSQMVGLQAADSISGPKITVDLSGLLDKLKQPLADIDRPTPIPSIVPMPNTLKGNSAQKQRMSSRQMKMQKQRQSQGKSQGQPQG